MTESRHVAIVEDEQAIRDNYAAALARHGYRVSGYGSRLNALEAFAARLPDLVIIDINLGNEAEGGYELCRELRARSGDLPIIFLTARDSEIDVVSGLRLGADDYLTKRVSIDQLLARVAALFRRLDAVRNAAPARALTCGDLRLDAERMHASWRGQAVELTVTEFWIVFALVRHPGHVRSREQLMTAANTVLDDATVTSQIKRIRGKFVAIDPDFAAIRTVYGMGYRWDASADD